VVARENFGPRVAQVAAVALLIDYVVTVAVQTAAGSAAIISAFPALSHIPVIGPRIRYDPATIAALKYARSLRPTVLRAVHFSLDSARADQLCRQWVDAETGISLELADCPDRRLAHAAARLATSLAAGPGTHVTIVLPRRCYPPLAGRLLHDHTADRIARVVSRVPDAAATIVPFDVTHRVGAAQAKRSMLASALRPGRLEDYEWPAPPPETDPIGSLREPGQATVQGRLRAAEIRFGQPTGSGVLACEVTDSAGELTAIFLGRSYIAGIEPGTRIRLQGPVGIGADGRPVMTNPAYELLA